MIDYHCHLLPGLDDGARNEDDALIMAQLLAKAGFREICCTPHHLRGVWNNTPDKVRAATAQFQDRLDEEGIPLRLHPGMEYYLDEFLADTLTSPLPLPGGMVLVEMPTNSDPDMVRHTCFRLVSAGHRLLIAHPERSLSYDDLRHKGRSQRSFLNFFHKPLPLPINPLLAYLMEIGCIFQGNLGSKLGIYGPQVKENVEKMLADRLFAHWGSDGHNPRQLEQILKAVTPP